jgi:hypothetical protein
MTIIHKLSSLCTLGQIITAIYLKVSISDFLTLFSARTGDDFFWTTAPAPILMGAGFIALTISTILACAWPSGNSDGVYAMGLGRRKPYTLALYIWLYCIVWWFIQDACKVFAFYMLKKFNIFGYNDTGKKSMELLFLLVAVGIMIMMIYIIVRFDDDDDDDDAGFGDVGDDDDDDDHGAVFLMECSCLIVTE